MGLSFVSHKISQESRILVMLWFAQIFVVTRFYWKRGTPNVYALGVAAFVGINAFINIQGDLVGESAHAAAVGILSGLILASAIYAMNLGHWYLNVHGLPIAHLMRTVYVFWGLVGLRAVWDLSVIAVAKVAYHGDTILLFQFIGTFDGFFLLIALLFGTLFPLITLYFVRGTLLVKSTQSATGILYVILVAVLIGELTFKYYLIKYGIVL